MAGFFKPNIDRKGRIARLIWGLLSLGGGVWLGLAVSWWLGGLLFAAAALSFYEAARSWCILRACGIKTKF
jgi:hypothetical protein